MYFDLFFILPFVFHVLPRSDPTTKNSNPSKELKPKSQEHKWKQEEKIKLNTNRKNEEQWTQSNCQTQIHHNCPAPSTKPNCQNSSNLREKPNSTPRRSSKPATSDFQQTSEKSQIQHLKDHQTQHHQIYNKPQRKLNPINPSQNDQRIETEAEIEAELTDFAIWNSCGIGRLSSFVWDWEVELTDFPLICCKPLICSKPPPASSISLSLSLNPDHGFKMD